MKGLGHQESVFLKNIFIVGRWWCYTPNSGPLPEQGVLSSTEPLSRPGKYLLVQFLFIYLKLNLYVLYTRVRRSTHLCRLLWKPEADVKMYSSVSLHFIFLIKKNFMGLGGGGTCL